MSEAPREPIKPANWLQSVNCAIEGILWTARTQRHMRWHFLAALAVLLFAHFMGLSALEFILLAFAVTLVLFVPKCLETNSELFSRHETHIS